MTSLTTPVTDAAAADQAGWCEVYDIYLKAAITTPWGSTSILRLTTLPGGFDFFKPKLAPEADADQGDAASYNFWPIKRAIVRGDAKFTNDKMEITASNVTTEWAAMLAAVSWYDVAIIIRKVPTTYSGSLTADDCAVLWSGQVDACRVTARALVFQCSSDLAGLQAIKPAENMHANCRFRWADDLCTMLRFKAANYKSKTVGSSSTTTRVKSAGLTEDSGSAASYGTELINALSDGAITASSYTAGFSAVGVGVSAATDLVTRFGHGFSRNDVVRFAASVMPSPLVAATDYYVLPISPSTFHVAATADGAPIDLTTNGTAVTMTSNSFEAFRVKTSKTGYWKFGDAADWGDVSQGFYLIPDAQAGLANAALKPYIQFDFGSAVTPKLWRLKTPSGLRMEELVRLVAFFSSPDNATWTHQTYFEMPPTGGQYFDVLIPAASSARYWRICVRTRYGDSLYYTMFDKVCAYADGRHWWANGRITFDAATATAALRNISRPVLESYSGEVVVPTLPAAPASGDTFVIERGCARTFNACCTRGNWENFGGFTDLPYQAVIR